MSASGVGRRDGVKFALDTSCLVALVAEWHERHLATVRAYQARLRRGEGLVIAGHAFLECFSVLTRLPPPLAVAPQSAQEVLSNYVSGTGEIAGMAAEACRLVVRDLANQNIGGGCIYDAIIALCSYQAGATTLMTWDQRTFFRSHLPA